MGPGVNLEQGVLTNANLNGVDLTGADLHGADLSNADLSYATLTGVQSSGITGTPTALPQNWRLVDGYLMGPGANLANAN